MSRNKPVAKRAKTLKAKGGKKAAFSWLVDGANIRERMRFPWEPLTTASVVQEVRRSDRLQLLSDSRKLYFNVGPCRGAINMKAQHAIGRSWLPKFEGKDEEWGRQSEQWLTDVWYPIADVHGRDFQTHLFLLSVGVDRDGDVAPLLTEYETGTAAVQIIPSHAIGQRENDGKIDAGPYKGCTLIDGVIINDIGRPVAYRVLGDKKDGSADQDVSARDINLLMEPEWADQIRGYPGFSHAILDLKTLRQVQRYEEMASALASSIGLLEFNETGMPDFGDPRTALMGGPGMATGMQMEERAGGLVKYFRANSGSKLDTFKNERPGDAWEKFQNRLLRMAMVGIGWPYELAWDIAALGGANTRLILATAMHTVSDRQELLRPYARRAVGYAICKAIKNGDLPANDEWYKWAFTMPARITSDYGRDAKADRDDYLAGITNLGDILAEQGKSLDAHIAQRAAENAKLRAAGIVIQQPAQSAVAPAAEEPDGDEEDDAEDGEDSEEHSSDAETETKDAKAGD